jgi:hypothetical protein
MCFCERMTEATASAHARISKLKAPLSCHLNSVFTASYMMICDHRSARLFIPMPHDSHPRSMESEGVLRMNWAFFPSSPTSFYEFRRDTEDSADLLAISRVGPARVDIESDPMHPDCWRSWEHFVWGRSFINSCHEIL